jgi:hypothetical protein
MSGWVGSAEIKIASEELTASIRKGVVPEVEVTELVPLPFDPTE